MKKYRTHSYGDTLYLFGRYGSKTFLNLLPVNKEIKPGTIAGCLLGKIDWEVYMNVYNQLKTNLSVGDPVGINNRLYVNGSLLEWHCLTKKGWRNLRVLKEINCIRREFGKDVIITEEEFYDNLKEIKNDYKIKCN